MTFDTSHLPYASPIPSTCARRSSKYKGVYYRASRSRGARRWETRYTPPNGGHAKINLGCFSTEEEAGVAYAKAVKYFEENPDAAPMQAILKKQGIITTERNHPNTRTSQRKRKARPTRNAVRKIKCLKDVETDDDDEEEGSSEEESSEKKDSDEEDGKQYIASSSRRIQHDLLADEFLEEKSPHELVCMLPSRAGSVCDDYALLAKQVMETEFDGKDVADVLDQGGKAGFLDLLTECGVKSPLARVKIYNIMQRIPRRRS